MNNTKRYYLYHVLIGGINLFTIGSFFQTFLLEKGYAEDTVNILFSVMQAVQSLVMVLFSKKADNLKSVSKALVFFALFRIPLCVYAMILSITSGNGNMHLAILFFLSVIFNISVGAYSILECKLPYRIMDMSHYGKVVSIANILFGIVNLLVSVLISFFIARYKFFSTMAIAYFITVIGGIYLLHNLSKFKENKIADDKNNTKQNKGKNIFKYEPFTILIVPNILRGFCLGMIGFVVTIGYYTERIDATSTSYIVIITNAVYILASWMYSFIAEKIKECNILLFASVAVTMFFPLMFLGGRNAYLIFYGITYFFITIINLTVPVLVTKIVDYDIIGRYSAGRLLLNAFGTMLAGFICMPMLRCMGGLLTLLTSAIAQLISGVCYFCYLKQTKNNNNT